MRVKLDELRRNSDTEYFDIMLLHRSSKGSLAPLTDNAQWSTPGSLRCTAAKDRAHSHCASVHGLACAAPAFRGHKWPDQSATIRMNYKGAHRDATMRTTPGTYPAT